MTICGRCIENYGYDHELVANTEVLSGRFDIDGVYFIRERTCANCKTGDFWRCSSCGCEILLRHNDWVTLYMGEVNFCPNCGAKVVEE